MKRRRVLVVLGVAATLDSVLVGLVTGPASAQQHWPGFLKWLRAYPWEALGALTVMAALLAILMSMRPEKENLAADPSSQANALATAIRREWERETRRWRILDPYPLPIRWAPAEEGLTTSWSDLIKLANATPGQRAKGHSNWAAGPGALAGGENDLANILNLVPTRSLLVLGQAGAGKTILLVRLVLDLLSERQQDEPVPLLLSLASWNPAQEDLDSWIVHWLTTEKGGLGQLPGRGGVTTARALLDAGLILPVLDGLDEIPDDLRGSAVARINEFMRPGHEIVVACRTSAYRATVHPVSGIAIALTGVAAIELCPLMTGEVIEYLQASAGGPEGAARWSHLITRLVAEPTSPVTRVLTTPLMAALARAVYNPRPGEGIEGIHSDPTELLDTERFSGEADVENFLYDHFIPAAYRPTVGADKPGGHRPWSAEQAQRWLAFVARNMETRQNGTTDLMWWRLQSAARPDFAGIVLGVLLATVAGIGYPFVGFGLGALVGLLVGLAVRRDLSVGRSGIAFGLAGGLLGGVLAGLVALAILGPGPKDFLTARIIPDGLGLGVAFSPLGRFIPGLIAGIVGSLAAAFYQYAPAFHNIRASVGPGFHLLNAIGLGLTAYLTVRLAGRNTPARGLQWSPVWFACSAGSGVLLGAAVWLTSGRVAGLATILAGTFAGVLCGGLGEAIATDLSKAADPISVLLRDRRTFAASWLGLGAAIGLGTGIGTAFRLGADGHPAGFAYGLAVGLSNFLIAGIGFGFVQAAWGQYALIHWWLAIRRKLPWRLMAFLRDASVNRGVLRQFGAVYQFRHVEVQRRIGRLDGNTNFSPAPYLSRSVNST
jgi:hypothetical protein